MSILDKFLNIFRKVKKVDAELVVDYKQESRRIPPIPEELKYAMEQRLRELQQRRMKQGGVF